MILGSSDLAGGVALAGATGMEYARRRRRGLKTMSECLASMRAAARRGNVDAVIGLR